MRLKGLGVDNFQRSRRGGNPNSQGTSHGFHKDSF